MQREISLKDLSIEQKPYEIIEFLKIPLKHEIKTVEITTDRNYVSTLKSKNDYLLLKYILELKTREIKQKNWKLQNPKDSKPENPNSQSRDTGQDGLQTTREEIGFSSLTSVGVDPTDCMTGNLRINLDHSETEHADFQIAMTGIEAWLKYNEDYEILLDHMKIWEQQNYEYISEFTHEGQSIFNTPMETPNKTLEDSSRNGKKKRGPGDFDFDNESIEEGDGGVVDFDAILKRQKTNEANAKKNGLSQLPELNSKPDRGWMKKFLCCF
jgi:hypothetical protein